MENDFVSVPRYAQLRGVSPKLVYQLVSRGLPHFRYGERIVIPVKAADRWAEEYAERKAQVKEAGPGT